ncbi:MAG: DUF4062 domain-containing protein [Deltaproteobacteria bacterium]|nr:DUF4062 domain-containing protein [Deltaproteobacteria bacterium]
MVKSKIVKHIFVSSTVSDLQEERAFVKQYLESHKGTVAIKCLLSEAPDFPVIPTNLFQDTYQICLDNLLRSDYVIQLLNKRYGIPEIEDAGELISITHKEYREALKRGLPIFTLTNKRLWNAYNAYKKGKHQSYVNETQLLLFSLLDEIQGHPRKNWIFRYGNIYDIATILKTNLLTFDDSIFVADVTIPDGTIVEPTEKFEKVWEIRNNGMVVWENRFLREKNRSDLISNSRLVEIPRILPEEVARINVVFTVPKYPGSYRSYWKMVTANGQYCFPWKKGIGCEVTVLTDDGERWPNRG